LVMHALDRYAARYERFCTRCARPHSGPAREARQKK
jgi:hypothetical protein